MESGSGGAERGDAGRAYFVTTPSKVTERGTIKPTVSAVISTSLPAAPHLDPESGDAAAPGELGGQRLPKRRRLDRSHSPEPVDRALGHLEPVSHRRLISRGGECRRHSQRGGVESLGAAREGKEQHEASPMPDRGGSQSRNPEGVVRTEAEHAGVAAIDEHPVVSGVHPEPVEQVQLQPTAQRRSCSPYRTAHRRTPCTMSTRGAIHGLIASDRIGNREGEADAYRETELVHLFVGQKSAIGLGVPDSSLQRDRERNRVGRRTPCS